MVNLAFLKPSVKAEKTFFFFFFFHITPVNILQDWGWVGECCGCLLMTSQHVGTAQYSCQPASGPSSHFDKRLLSSPSRYVGMLL